MDTNKKTTKILENVKISTKMKISALWAATLFLYISVDIMSFFIPGGYIAQSMAGKIGFFTVSQGTMLMISILNTIPCVMVFITIILKPKASRRTNIIIGIYQTIINSLVFLSASWAYFIFFGIIESAFTVLIVWYALKWPHIEVITNDNT